MPFITGVFGPRESEEFGRVLSYPLLFYKGFFYEKPTNFVLKFVLLANKLIRFIL